MTRTRRSTKTFVTRSGEKVRAKKSKTTFGKKKLRPGTDAGDYFENHLRNRFYRELARKRASGENRYLLRVRTIIRFGKKKIPAYFGIPRAKLHSQRSKNAYLEYFKKEFQKTMEKYLARQLGASVTITGIETEVIRGVSSTTPSKVQRKTKTVRRRRHRSKKVGRVSRRRNLRRKKRKNVSKPKKVSRSSTKKLRRL